jgi:hypothetical protein
VFVCLPVNPTPPLYLVTTYNLVANLVAQIRNAHPALYGGDSIVNSMVYGRRLGFNRTVRYLIGARVFIHRDFTERITLNRLLSDEWSQWSASKPKVAFLTVQSSF